MATEAFAALFWPGVVCVYLGIWLLGRHLFDDDNILPRVPAIRKALVVVLGVVVGYYWSVNVAMTKAPMNISAYSTIGDYPPETNINGIPWNRDLYSDLRVDIDNPTDSDYRELDLDLAPDMMTVFAVAQLTAIPSVSFIAEEGAYAYGSVWLGGVTVDGHQYASMPVQGQPINLNKPVGIRVLCDKLPRRSTLRIVLAVVALHYVPGVQMPEKMALPKRVPEGLYVSGHFRAIGRERPISVKCKATHEPTPP